MNITKSTANVANILLWTNTSLHYIHELAYAFLYQPFIMGRMRLSVTLEEPGPGRGDEDPVRVIEPDLERLRAYQLVILPQGELQRFSASGVKSLISYLDEGGALLAVQPMDQAGEMPSELAGRLGLSFQGWADECPDFSYTDRHVATRILGRKPGESAYPHRRYWPYMKFAPDAAGVISFLGKTNDPDLVCSRVRKAAAFSTDVFCDLLRYLQNPGYPRFEEDLSLLVANVVSYLLGLDWIREPAPKVCRRWRELLQAYAVNKLFILSLARQLSETTCSTQEGSEGTCPAEVELALRESDESAHLAAQAALRGSDGEAWAHLKEGVGILSGAVTKLTPVKRYLVRGWHGGVLFDDYRLGGLVGYAEFGWPDWSVAWMKRELEWAAVTGAKQINDVSPATWELLERHYPDDIKAFRQATEDGVLEPMGGIYSHAYLELLSAESNVRQLRYGIGAFAHVLGRRPETFACAADHYAFHPQLPQVLKGFEYKYVVLRSGRPGEIKGVQAEKIWWRGLDGTEIEALPTYQGVPEYYWPTPRLDVIAAAHRLGYKSIILGKSNDATRCYFGEKEDMVINPIAPVVGRSVTYGEYFSDTPGPETSIYFGVDELYGRPQYWAGFSSVNEFYRLNRQVEDALLAAEAFDAVAHMLNGEARSGEARGTNQEATRMNLGQAWAMVLATQDHFNSGCGEAEGPEGFHTGSYHEPAVIDYPGPRTPVTCYDSTMRCFSEASSTARSVLTQALNTIVDAIDTGTDPGASTPGLIPIVVFNSLGWHRKAIAGARVGFEPGQARKVRVYAISENKAIVDLPCQVLSESRYNDGTIKESEIIFLAGVPPFGYNTCWVGDPEFMQAIRFDRRENCHGNNLEACCLSTLEGSKTIPGGELKAGEHFIENEYYRVELHPVHGGITRVFDKELNLDILDTTSWYGNEITCTSRPKISSRDATAITKVTENGPCRVSLGVESYVGTYPYRSTISLYRGLKRIEFDLTIEFGEGAIFGSKMEEETSLRAVFSPAFGGRLFINQPFGVYETLKQNQVTLDFADISNGQHGLCLVHYNTPCCLYDGKALSVVLADGFPPVRGTRTYRYALYTHKGTWKDGQAFRNSRDINTPLYPVVTDTHTGSLPASGSFVSVEGEDLVLSTLYRDSNRIFMRLYNLSDEDKNGHAVIFRKPVRIDEVSLNQTVINPGMVEDNKIPIRLGPWQIRTYAWDSP